MAQVTTAFYGLTVFQIVKEMGVRFTPQGVNPLGLASAKAFANALVAEAEAFLLEQEGKIEQALEKYETAFDLLDEAIAKAS